MKIKSRKDDYITIRKPSEVTGEYVFRTIPREPHHKDEDDWSNGTPLQRTNNVIDSEQEQRHKAELIRYQEQFKKFIKEIKELKSRIEELEKAKCK